MTSGCSTHDPDDQEISENLKNLMLRLSESMLLARNREAETEFDNPRIPAGYTYLGQFIAHDLVFSAFQSMELRSTEQAKSEPATPALAEARLDLGSLYGPGPGIAPHLYIKEPSRRHRWRLSLSAMTQKEDAVQFPHAVGAAMDLVRCPHLNGKTTAISADPRNDMHVLINQLTVLFAKFHNHIAGKVETAMKEEAAANRTPLDESLIFPITRDLVLAAYRTIILGDFLQRLLDPGVYDAAQEMYQVYRSGSVTFPRQKNRLGGFVVSREFASAAFRVGHVMARKSYALSVARTNENIGGGPTVNPNAGLGDMISLTSSGRLSSSMKQNWDVEWDRFFFNTDENDPQLLTHDGRARNFSHLISPTAPVALARSNVFFGSKDKQNGGVIYLDLIRNLGDGLDDADATIAKIAPNLSPDQICNANQRKILLTRHFTLAGQLLLSAQDIEALSQRTPLYLYILIEAMDQGQNGQHLGPVGSRIIAGVISHAIFAASAETESARLKWGQYFATGMPGTMPELLAFLTEPEPVFV